MFGINYMDNYRTITDDNIVTESNEKSFSEMFQPVPPATQMPSESQRSNKRVYAITNAVSLKSMRCLKSAFKDNKVTADRHCKTFNE